MKRIVLVSLLLSALAGLTTVPARAQVCIDFDIFCDGLELNIDGHVITGFWRNADCEGYDVPVVGTIYHDLPRPCEPGASTEKDGEKPIEAGVICVPQLGCVIYGWKWYFAFDGLDGTFDMGYAVSDGNPMICTEETSYHILEGPCPFKPDRTVPSTSRFVPR